MIDILLSMDLWFSLSLVMRRYPFVLLRLAILNIKRGGDLVAKFLSNLLERQARRLTHEQSVLRLLIGSRLGIKICCCSKAVTYLRENPPHGGGRDHSKYCHDHVVPPTDVIESQGSRGIPHQRCDEE